ncbi:MAG: hypothetical protein N4A74_26580 [Carboxylicivirga sp.]|jgi:hypothetical protein|nr:hypothetical protein [Carboxylicivirga sp.]
MNKILLVLAGSLLFLACTKDDVDKLSSAIDVDKKEDRVLLSAKKSYSETGEELSYKWSSDNDAVFINDNNKSKAFFIYPDSNSASHISVNLKISDGNGSQKVTEHLVIPAFNDHIQEWGLGNYAWDRVSNDVNYNWYIDQKNTGIHSGNNCGPTVVTMAAKWIDEKYNKTPEYARSKYYPEGGWWYTIDIMDFLSDVGVNRWVVPLIDKSVDTQWIQKSTDIIVEQLQKGNILILCLDMHVVRDGINQNHRIDKFYGTSSGWGHFLIVKGFRLVDNTMFFEVYDPYSWSEKYGDGGYKGKNRYYRSEDLLTSTNSWWNFSIVVSRNPNPDSGSTFDYKEVKHAWGK